MIVGWSMPLDLMYTSSSYKDITTQFTENIFRTFVSSFDTTVVLDGPFGLVLTGVVSYSCLKKGFQVRYQSIRVTLSTCATFDLDRLLLPAHVVAIANRQIVTCLPDHIPPPVCVPWRHQKLQGECRVPQCSKCY